MLTFFRRLNYIIIFFLMGFAHYGEIFRENMMIFGTEYRMLYVFLFLFVIYYSGAIFIVFYFMHDYDKKIKKVEKLVENIFKFSHYLLLLFTIGLSDQQEMLREALNMDISEYKEVYLYFFIFNYIFFFIYFFFYFYILFFYAKYEYKNIDDKFSIFYKFLKVFLYKSLKNLMYLVNILILFIFYSFTFLSDKYFAQILVISRTNDFGMTFVFLKIKYLYIFLLCFILYLIIYMIIFELLDDDEKKDKIF